MKLPAGQDPAESLRIAGKAYIEEYGDRPAHKDIVFQVKQALYELGAILESPGERAAREAGGQTGQDPVGFADESPLHVQRLVDRQRFRRLPPGSFPRH
jgi:hypothetical protein